MNYEDDAFNDIERMSKIKQEMVKAQQKRLTLEEQIRNEVIEEVAREFETFTHAFGVDTVASFQIFVRAMKT